MTHQKHILKIKKNSSSSHQTRVNGENTTHKKHIMSAIHNIDKVSRDFIGELRRKMNLWSNYTLVPSR